MFNLAMGNLPGVISEIFTRSEHFKRNLNFVPFNSKFTYLQKIPPNSLITTWNNIHRSHRDWVKETPLVKNKTINAPLTKLPNNNCVKLNRFRLAGFKKSLLDTFLASYKENIRCNNSHCRDCN